MTDVIRKRGVDLVGIENRRGGIDAVGCSVVWRLMLDEEVMCIISELLLIVNKVGRVWNRGGAMRTTRMRCRICSVVHRVSDCKPLRGGLKCRSKCR